MLDKRAAFKVAFLRNCAEKGLSLKETHNLVKVATLAFEKEAADGVISKLLGSVGKGVGKTVDIGSNIAGKGVDLVSTWGVPLALGAPIAVGGAVGYGLGSASGQLSDVDIDEVKDQEKIEAIRQAIARVKLNNSLTQQRQNKPRPSRPLI